MALFHVPATSRQRLIECHSRKMYVEFTHSQSFETFVRCHMHAFEMMTGIARELWYDNLATAVAEHEGNLVRFAAAIASNPFQLRSDFVLYKFLGAALLIALPLVLPVSLDRTGRPRVC
jgi:hypothetical protein